MDWKLAHVIWANGGYIAAILCGLWTIWKGGPTEKKGAALIAFGWIASPILTMFDEPGPGTYVRALDTIIFVGFMILALWSRRLWVFITCMCMLNGLVTYIVADYKAFAMYSHVTATGFWLGYALLICLGFGIIDYQRTLKRRLLSPAPAASSAQG